jgi:hypothetical protein
MRRNVFMIGAAVLLLAVFVHAQDSPSLGDVARQARAQKQQKDAQAKDAASKDATGKDGAEAGTGQAGSKVAKTPRVITNRVITNEELPAHAAPAVADTNSPRNPHTDAADPGANTGKNDAQSAEQWKEQIQAQKSAIADLKKEIDGVSSSIHYTGAGCVSNCAEWNEKQQEKQQQVESMKAQLEQQQQSLEEMQEAARRQGFGSSVYDP